MSNQTSNKYFTNDAPIQATQSLMPEIVAFTDAAGVAKENRDKSLDRRNLSQFSDMLDDDQKVSDDLAELGKLVFDASANIMKLPNISASLPQLKAAVRELQDKGYDLPDYPDEPQNEDRKSVV